MSIATDIQSALSVTLPDYTFQFGAWADSGVATDRFCVIQPVGGQKADIVRYPEYRMLLVGCRDDGEAKTNDDALAVIEYLRANSSFGDLDEVLPGEPIFWTTSEDRPVFEVPLSIFTR